MNYSLACVSCGTSCDETQSTTVCPSCGGQLDVRYDVQDILRSLNIHALRTTPISATKYLRFLPIQDFRKIVSLHEGGTPLQHCTRLGKKLGLNRLFVKNEGANPTGVFKDRGSMVEVTKAVELGAKAIACASTGNMAGSVSAYAAMAGLPCYVVIPEGTPLGKMAQTVSYGARIIQIRGTYADCVPLCQRMAEERGFYLAGDYAFRLEGAKTCAYEIIEQLQWKAPDVVIVPIGCGTHMAGIWKGFQDFHALKLIDRLPRMIGVQPEIVPTVVEAWRQGKERYIKVDKPASVASAVSIGVPQDDIKALAAMRDSGGCGETAADDAILDAEQLLASSESLFVEPASAIPVATLQVLLQKKLIGADETIVCVATGTGLKDPKMAVSHLPDPPILEPTNEDINRYFSLKLYDIKAKRGQQEVLFKTVPTMAELKQALKKLFAVSFDEQVDAGIMASVQQFLQKGRSVSTSDLKNIVETFLSDLSGRAKILSVEDFSVTDTKHAEATSHIKVAFHGKAREADGIGDGTFDAIINAIEKITKSDQLGVRLTDYEVGIATPGSAAVVKVTMAMADSAGHTVTVSATSPDVIVASLEAYEKGYNLLYYRAGRNGG
ncbi:MAG: threonine synthase [Candidatus Peribacteraceae bacterium]|nr:threonine synthase [Candidatus Peribacteraceae bacterium]